MKPPNLSRFGSRLGSLGLVVAALGLGVVGGCWKVNPGPAPLIQAQHVPVVVLPARHGDPELIVTVRAGSAYDPVGREGLAFQAAMAVNSAGTASRTADEIHMLWRAWGASLSVEVGRERAIFHLKAPAEHIVEGAGILAELVASPQLGTGALDLARFEGVTLAQAGGASTVDLAGGVLGRLTYDGHPYGHVAYGRFATANLVSELDVSQFREQRYLRSVVVAGVVGLPEGAPEASAAADALRAGLERLPPRLSRDITPRLSPTRQGRAVVLVQEPRADIDVVAIGQSLDLRWHDPDGPALLVAVQALSDRLSASFGGSAARALWVEPFTAIQGELRVELSVPRAADPIPVPAVLSLIDLFAQDGVDEDAVVGARATLIDALAHDPALPDWRLASMLLKAPDPATALPPSLDALTPAAVNAAIARWIHPDRLSIAVVADDPETYRQAFIEYPDASGVQPGGYALGVKSLTVVSIEELNP